jgi:hypothetical protein
MSLISFRTFISFPPFTHIPLSSLLFIRSTVIRLPLSSSLSFTLKQAFHPSFFLIPFTYPSQSNSLLHFLYFKAVFSPIFPLSSLHSVLTPRSFPCRICNSPSQIKMLYHKIPVLRKSNRKCLHIWTWSRSVFWESGKYLRDPTE